MEMGANAGARYSILHFQSSSYRMKSFSKETAKLHNQKEAACIGFIPTPAASSRYFPLIF